jgi:sugar/nucleoside kinase (ribokinase family)
MEAQTVYAIGECMIELQRSAGSTGMDYRFGGDTLNAAVYMSRLLDPAKVRVAYVTGLGVDGMSAEMLASWEKEGIDTRCVQRLPDRLPGIYMIETDPTASAASITGARIRPRATGSRRPRPARCWCSSRPRAWSTCRASAWRSCRRPTANC